MNWYLRRLRISPVKALAFLGVGGVVIAGIIRYAPRRYLLPLFAILIAVLVVVLLLRYLFKWRNRSRARAMYDGIEAQQQKQLHEANKEEEKARLAEIKKRFDKAVSELRSAKKTIYDLPWIMLIGEPQSGKSMTLRGSELHFPVGTQELSGLGGTRNCDWWFTNEAIILDTAGRFTFQAEGAPDHVEWMEFLSLLARKRRHCPINGVLLVIPVDSLLTDGAEIVKEKAKNIHEKLGELQRKLGVQFPVFLLITKCDLMHGFSEFFENFGAVKAAQIMGWSNTEPFNKAYRTDRLKRDVDNIYRRLVHRRLELMRQVPSLRKRGLIYGFPEEFKRLAMPLKQYLDIIFAPDIYHDSLFFRGFYFTSGMQEGNTIKTLGEDLLGDRHQAVGTGDVLGELFPSRPFFCEDLYKQKALRETGMVFRSADDIKRSKRLRRTSLIGGCALAVILILLLFFGGYEIAGLIQRPEQNAIAATDLILKPDVSNRRRVKPEAIVRRLQVDVANLDSVSWLIRAALFGRGFTGPQDNIKTIHDHVVMRRIIGERVRKLELTLAEPGAWAEFDTCRTSMIQYCNWATRYNDDRKPGEAFRDLFGPLGDEAELQKELFSSLYLRDSSDETEMRRREAELRRRTISDDAFAAQGAMDKIISASTGAFKRKYASPETPYLIPYIDLGAASDAVEQSVRKLLGLRSELAEVTTVGQYDQALTKWRKHYQGALKEDVQSESRRGFRPSLQRVRHQLKELEVRENREKVKEPVKAESAEIRDEDLVPDLELPTLGELRPKWTEFFGERMSESETGDAFKTLYAKLGALHEADAIRMRELIDRAVDRLDAAGREVIAEKIRAHWLAVNNVQKGFKIREAVRGIEQLLQQLDRALPPKRVPRLTEDLIKWVAALPKDDNAKEDGVQEALQTCEKVRDRSDLPVTWNSSAFCPLVQWVDGISSRHRWYVELDEARGYLDGLGEDESLADLCADANEGLEQSRVGYEGMRKRDTYAFVTRMRRAVEQIDANLDAGRKWLVEKRRDDATGRDREIDPADEVMDLLTAGFERFARAYFSAWDKRYHGSFIPKYEVLVNCSTWTDYLKKLLSDEESSRFETDAAKQLYALEDNVLATGRYESSKTGAGESVESQRTADLLAVLDGARDYPLGKASRLQPLAYHRHLARGNGETTKKLGDEASRAFGEFKRSVRAFENLGTMPRSIDDAPTIKSKSLTDLKNKYKDNLVIRQLYYVVKNGEYLLNNELDTRFDTLLSEFDALEDRFPFTRPPPSEKPDEREVNQYKFKEFLLDMDDFASRYGGVAPRRSENDPRKQWKDTIGRSAYLRRCLDWQLFLYGDPNESDEKKAVRNSAERVNDGTPWEVYYTVYFEESDDHSINEFYKYATLVLCDKSDRQGRDTRRNDLTFEINNARYPEKTADKTGDDRFHCVWRFQDKRDVSLTFTLGDSSAANIRNFPRVLRDSNSTISDTIWGLPIFIYRHLDDRGFARIRQDVTGGEDQRREWKILVTVDVPVDNKVQPSEAIFSIGFKEVDLPELIGRFEANTTKPEYLKDPSSLRTTYAP